MTVIRLGDLVVGGVPWELFSSIGARARQASTHFQAALCGYTNGYYGYLAEPPDIRQGGYEIDWQPIVYGVATEMPLPMADDAADAILWAFAQAANALYHPTA